MQVRRFFTLSVPFFALGVALSKITEHAPAPEQVTHLWFALPAFLIFVLFALSILSMGAFLRTRISFPKLSGAENGLIDLTLGSVAFYGLAYALTCLGLFSSGNFLFLWAVIAVFFGMGASAVGPALWFDFAKSKMAKFFLAIPLFIIFLRLLEGLEIHLHGDAYITYLPAPRVWAEFGSFQKFLDFSQFFLSTSFESLFAWGTALMNLKGSAGLDLSQYFAQWCVGGIALLGILLGTIALCKRIAEKFPVSEIYFPIVAVSAMQVPTLRWTANLAKNDMGVAFWGLSAFYFTVFLAGISPVLAFVAGAVTGAAVIGKLTLSLFAICLAVYTLLTSPKRFVWFGIGGIAGGLPVFLRNYFLTKNPVFPWLPNLFPATPILSKGQIEGALHPTATSFQWSNLGSYLLELQNQLPLLFVLLLVLIFIRNRETFLKWISVPILASLFFIFAFRPSTEIRYQNASLVILAALTTYFTFQILTLLPLPRKLHKILSPLFVIAIIATANITAFTLFQLGSGKFAPISKRLSSLTGGEAKLWIRENLTPKDSVLLVGDQNVYYLIDHSIREIHQTPSLDDEFTRKNPAEFLTATIASSFDYLRIETDDDFWDTIAKARALFAEMKHQDPACARFSTAKTQVWDLKCIRDRMKR